MKKTALLLLSILLLAGCGEYRYEPETLEVPEWAKGTWYSNDGAVVSISDKDISLDSNDPELAGFSVLIMLEDDYYISSQHLAESNDVWTLELGSFGDGQEMEITISRGEKGSITMAIRIETETDILILSDKPFNDSDPNSW